MIRSGLSSRKVNLVVYGLRRVGDGLCDAY